MDKYYRDVGIDMDFFSSLLEIPIDVSSRLQYVDNYLDETKRANEDIETFGANYFHFHPTQHKHFPFNYMKM